MVCWWKMALISIVSIRQASLCQSFRLPTSFIRTSSRRLSKSFSQSSSPTNSIKPRVLSGVQPTGQLTLGNLVGAIHQWVDLQDKYDTYFCVVDLHAATSNYDPKSLSDNTLSVAAMYLAAGIDPKKSHIFIQSHVKAHSEMCWLLNTQTPMGWLQRMVQFKEKASKERRDVCIGLLDYPVLMAADILLYQTSLVPVGEDQRQHLELARDIARRFNSRFGGDTFIEPEAVIIKEGARIMSLSDARDKMSKSAESDNSRINLLDTPDMIRKKIKKCKSDSGFSNGLYWDKEARPEATNLLNIYQVITNKTQEEVLKEVGEMQWGSFKPLLAEAIIAYLEPLQTRYYALLQDKSYLHSVLRDGAEGASIVAEKTLYKSHKAMGFMTSDDIAP